MMKKGEVKMFNKDQLEQITLGHEAGVDTSWYARPELTQYQMFTVRMRLERAMEIA